MDDARLLKGKCFRRCDGDFQNLQSGREEKNDQTRCPNDPLHYQHLQVNERSTDVHLVNSAIVQIGLDIVAALMSDDSFRVTKVESNASSNQSIRSG